MAAMMHEETHLVLFVLDENLDPARTPVIDQSNNSDFRTSAFCPVSLGNCVETVGLQIFSFSTCISHFSHPSIYAL